MSNTTPKQTKISSFFSPNAQKRAKTNNPCDLPEAKKQKLGKENEEGAQEETLSQETEEALPPCEEPVPPDQEALPPCRPLSPEDKGKIEKNKMNAKLKLLSTKTHGLVTNFGPSWLPALEAEFSKDYFLKLSQFVASERTAKTVFPPASDVFSWTRMCPIERVKVVILGQDPYHGPGQAHGLCFSVQKGVPPPPSLINMYKELEMDIPGFQRPSHGYLGGWAEQGVLLLNACLTVRKAEANSHKDKGWETFTDAVIETLSKTRPRGLVFILWGSYAQKKGNVIDRKRPGHYVLSGVHPSPLSAHRGFMGCKHFSKANELLVKEGLDPVDWKHLPLP